jgi:hypothetical protein
MTTPIQLLPIGDIEQEDDLDENLDEEADEEVGF